MRVKIATGILVLIGLVSIYTPLNFEKLRVSPNNEVLVILDRTNCIKNDLPKGEHFFGFLPPVDLIIRSTDDLMNISESMRRLFLTRYALTPDLVAPSPDAPWVIGSFRNREIALPVIEAAGLTIVKDCQNGIFLLKR